MQNNFKNFIASERYCHGCYTEGSVGTFYFNHREAQSPGIQKIELQDDSDSFTDLQEGCTHTLYVYGDGSALVENDTDTFLGRSVQDALYSAIEEGAKKHNKQAGIGGDNKWQTKVQFLLGGAPIDFAQRNWVL